MKQIFVVYQIDMYSQITLLAAYEDRESAELLARRTPNAFVESTYFHFKKK